MGFYDFLKRHRRKFFITGAVVGGAFAVGKFVQWKLSEYGDWLMAEEVSRARKKHHYDSNQRTCRMTVVTLLPSLRENIFAILDTESLTTRLKSNPENKIATWQELKTVTVSRFVASIYACCLLVTFLRIQLNILGGCMYHGETQSASSVFHTSTDVHKEYLAAVQYFLGPGLSRLIDLIQSKVQAKIGSVSLKEKVTAGDVEKIVTQIRQSMESSPSTTQPSPAAAAAAAAAAASIGTMHPLALFLLPPEDTAAATVESPSTGSDGQAASIPADARDFIRQLMAHTRDVMESHDFRSSLHSCLDAGFQFGLSGLSAGMEAATSDGPAARTPLAKVIPIINAQSHVLFTQQDDGLLPCLMSLEILEQFSANIYEAFSHETSFQ